MEYMAEDVVWEMHNSSSGHTTFNGKAEIGKMDGSGMPEKLDFNFTNVVIQDNVAVVEGTGSGIKPDGSLYNGIFCDIYHFNNGKIMKITSYVIDTF